ncbi:MAG: hypothetical protein ACKVS8_09020 [Phycisphaerales bacterium]
MTLRSSRKGSIYVIVLFTVVAVVAMVMGGFELQRAARRGTQTSDDAAHARLLARSAIELGLQVINDDPARTTVPANGAWIAATTVGKGVITLNASDPIDGNLTNKTDQPIVLESSATLGQAKQFARAKANPVFSRMPAITGSLVAKGAITFTTASVSTTNTVIGGATTTATTSSILAPVQSVTAATGSTYNSTRTTGAAPTIPTFAAASSAYTSGRPVGLTSLLTLGTFSKAVIAPGTNPFGVANAADGVYVVNCLGLPLTIKDCRIVGTLILLNASGGVTISGSVSWEPFTTGYPALIADGPVTIDTSAAALTEAGVNVNLNPSGIGLTPSDSDKTDSYPSRIRGIAYASGNVNTKQVTTIQGALVTPGTATVTGSLIIKNDPDLFTNPPPGFRTGPTMVVEANSYTQLIQ